MSHFTPALLARFRRARGGLAAVEFAFAVPLLLLILLGFYELDRYVETTRQLERAAAAVAQMLTQTTTDVSRQDLVVATDSLRVLAPRVLQDSARLGVDWKSGVQLGMTSVAFSTAPGCVSACVYSAKVSWSAGTSRRPCNVSLTAVADNTEPGATTLPTDVYGPNGLVVVDLAYAYAPVFATRLFHGFTIKRSAYLQPRYLKPATALAYAVPGGDDLVTAC